MPSRAAAGGIAAGGRAQWGSRIGFILSAIGSAVGFGSIARFPMNAANNGGALFVLLYAGIMLAVGVPLMIAEFSLGRAAQRNPVGTFKRLQGAARSRWRWAGVLYIIVPSFFLSWYAIVAGWTLHYVFATATGAYFDDPAGYITDASAGPDALAWGAGVLLLTLLAVYRGVSRGIEKVNLIMMPALFAIVAGLAIYAATLPDVADGYRFYLDPDLSALSLGVVIAAVGQAFFSLSLGQGAMLTYASYLPKRSSLAGNALLVSASTLTFAVACGFLIFPLLSSFGMLGTQEAGLGLIFGPLSAVFVEMGSPTGQIIGTLFFLATFFAAFTSAVSLTEPAIAYFVEERAISRSRASLVVCLAIYTAAVLPAVSLRALDLEGGALTDSLVILGALLIAVYVGWSASRRVATARIDEGSRLRVARIILPWLRYTIPAVLALLLFFSIAGAPCALSGGDESPGLIGELAGQTWLGCTPD